MGGLTGNTDRRDRRMSTAARRAARTAILLGAALGLAGCAAASSDPPRAAPPTAQPDELADARGEPCPEELPLGDDPGGYGFGVEGPATERPHLVESESAWLCRYEQITRESPDPGMAPLTWMLADGPVPVEADRRGVLRDALDAVAPIPDENFACTADLGPRWMVVTSHGGDLTAAVVDDYGCSFVRLSDNPHTTPPGADGQAGTVGGVLGGGRAILAALHVGRGR